MHRVGIRDRRDRDRDRRRDRDRGRDRDRDRGRDRDRDRRRRRRRSPSDDEDDEEEMDNFWKSGARHFGSRAGQPGAVTGPKKIWDGFQWVTQTEGVPESALTGTGLSRKARRLHFGNLPSMLGAQADQLLAKEIWDQMKQRGLECSKPGANPVLSVWLSGEQNFSFVEFLTAEDATNGLMLDGMMFMAQSLRVSRPSDYIPSADSSAVNAQLQAIQQLSGATGADGAAAPPPAAMAATEVVIFSNLTSPDTSGEPIPHPPHALPVPPPDCSVRQRRTSMMCWRTWRRRRPTPVRRCRTASSGRRRLRSTRRSDRRQRWAMSS